MLKYSTIVFDAGGTLLQMNYDAMARAYVNAAAAWNTPIDFNAARKIIEQLESELPMWQQTRRVSLEQDNGREFWNSFFAEGFTRLGIQHDVKSAADGIRARFQNAEFEMLFNDVQPTLAALQARGKQLGILSNFSTNLENIFRKLDVHRYFDFFVVSAAVGVEKPDARIFDLTVRAANRPRAEIVYIGDSVFHDIAGARRAGIDAILVDRRNRYPDFDGARVQNLNELVK
jgi:REG-2-like HAD superfamily hydrolase